MNDAVSIILYQIVSQPFSSIVSPILHFVYIFVGSVSVGLILALLVSLILKKSKEIEKNANYELMLLICTPFIGYYFAESFGMSGVLCALFNGVFTSVYAIKNVSSKTEDGLSQLFNSISYSFENLVFLFLGLSLCIFFKGPYEKYVYWGSIAICFLILVVSRYASIAIMTCIANITRSAANKLGSKIKYAIMLSGLRGSLAFALALKYSEYKMHSLESGVILCLVVVIALITVC